MAFRKNFLIYYDKVKSELCMIDSASNAQSERYPVDASTIASGNYAEAFADALGELPDKKNFMTAEFILPHNTYGVDFITLPLIKRSQLGEALKTELRSLYKNYADLIILSNEIYTGKTNITYEVTFVKKELLTSIRDVFAKKGIQIEKFIPYGTALLANAMKVNPSKKKGTTLLLHVEKGEAYIAVYGKDTLLGGLPIPFGLEALRDNHVSSERLLYMADTAELYTINAKERAKATKLTMAIDIENESIDDDIPDDETETIAPDPELPDITTVGEEHPPQAEEEDEEDEEIVPEVKIKTLKKSAVRSLPKFMLRETPTDEEGFIMENFRLFERRILLICKEMGLTEYMPAPEIILLSLGGKFPFIADKMSVEHPEWKWFMLSDNKNDTALYEGGASAFGKLPIFEL